MATLNYPQYNIRITDDMEQDYANSKEIESRTPSHSQLTDVYSQTKTLNPAQYSIIKTDSIEQDY